MISTRLPAHISALLNPSFYAYEVEQCQLLETHISWVILTGPYAYKIKKPVNFGFIDFSSLQKREFYCSEELRLNQRTAPKLYMQVLELTRNSDCYAFNGPGKCVDFVLQMHQFPQSARFDLILEQASYQQSQIDQLAEMLAGFHERCDIADLQSHYGTAQQVYQPMRENFQQMDQSHLLDAQLDTIADIKIWTEIKYSELQAVLEERKKQGYIRECHGDLHLSNLAWIEGQVLAFDCLEFNPDLRWIDVLSDLAFLIMDMQRCRKDKAAWSLLNRYLEYVGDYMGVKLLNFYLCYRALVMLKVETLRLLQLPHSDKEYVYASENINRYLQLAHAYTRQENPCLILNHGLSGSGKSTISQALAPCLKAIKISSDIERKRLFGLWPKWQQNCSSEAELYHPKTTQKIYAKLLKLAASMLAEGYSVIVDATFMEFDYRQDFYHFAEENSVPILLLSYFASYEVLQQRLNNRESGISDADLRVLQQQVIKYQPLKKEEYGFSLTIDSTELIDMDQLAEIITKKLGSKNKKIC